MDESKLPKWARDRLASLRHEVERIRADRDQLIGNGDPARCRGFWLERTGQVDPPMPAPLSGRHLVFRGTTGDLDLSDQTDRASGKTWLNINSPTGGLIVRPSVANVVTVRALERNELY